jgi:hypothetical protein
MNFRSKKNTLPLPKYFGLRMLKNDPFAATVTIMVTWITNVF